MSTKEKRFSLEVYEKDEDFNEMMENIPLRVLDIRPELEYYCNPDPELIDSIEFIERCMKTGKVIELSDATLDIATGLFKQGVLFRHSRKAIKQGATRYSKLDEQRVKQLEEQCNCPDCRAERGE